MKSIAPLARLSAANAARLDRLSDWYLPGRFGLFYHYGLFTGGGNAASRWKPEPLAFPTPEAFDAATPDPRAVARNLAAAAKDAGARYATLTVCHTCGGQVVLYPTERPEFLHRTRKDYVGPFLEACRAVGVMPMLYLPCDCNNWDNPQTGPNVPPEVAADPARYGEALLGLVDEIRARYGDLPAGFWLDGGLPAGCLAVPGRIRAHWPRAVVVANCADTLACDDVDAGTTECLDESVVPDPPYDRSDGYRKINAWGCTLPRTDFNEDIPTPNDWWFHGEDEPLQPGYGDDRFFLLRQMVCALGRRGLWNFHPGIGPRLDGTVPPRIRPMLGAVRHFLAWAGEAVRGTRGPAGTFVRSGWTNANGSLAFHAVTNRLDAPSVFYAIFTEAPSNGLALLDTMGREPRRATDLRTGRELPFRMWSGPVLEDGPWGDVAAFGAAVVKLEF